MRPSASSHDPRYLSARGRFLLLGGMGLAVALIGGGILGGFELSRRAQTRREQEARARTQAALDKGLEVARAQAATEAAWSCAALPKAPDDAVIVPQLPVGVAPPFREPRFVYADRGAREVYPFENSSYLLHAQVGRFEKVDQGYALEAHLALVDLAQGKVVCAGQHRVLVPGDSYPDLLLARGLARALCPEGSSDSTCERMGGVRPLPAPAAAAPEPTTPAPDVAVPAPTYKKGMKVLAERKGQWLPAVLLKPAKGGWRVAYEGKKRVQELVPLARLRPR